MSLSNETIMHNYRVKIAYIKRNIAQGEETAKLLLAQLEAIKSDANDCAELKKVLAELQAIVDKIESNPLLDQLDATKHVDLPLAKQVSNFLHRQLENMSDLQQRIVFIQSKVVENEMRSRLSVIAQRFDQSRQWSFPDFIKNISDSKLADMIIADYQKNKNELNRYSHQRIIDYVNQMMTKYYDSIEYCKAMFVRQWETVITKEDTLRAELTGLIQVFAKQDFFDKNAMMHAAHMVQTEIDRKMMDESARHNAITSIVKSIASRGFIIDAEAIRLVQENDERVVIVIAKKITGEVAIFKVYLDGRFVYKFDNYEGHTHDHDEQPFLDALTLYDVSLATEQKRQYDNPDRIMKDAKKAIDIKSDKNR